MEFNLSLEDKKFLLKLARTTLEEYLASKTNSKMSHGLEIPHRHSIRQNRGAFVTLKKEGQLRGCIGTFRADTPLYQTVQSMAIAAAVQDPRFPPVQYEELHDLVIEISALTRPKPITDISEIQVGTHGIFITKGIHSGVLLPQVATEYGWDRIQFLQQTCLKAGLPRNAWQQGATIEIFSAEVFSEEEDAHGN